eukprot:7378298-Prymnesium_polylepis.1
MRSRHSCCAASSYCCAATSGLACACARLSRRSSLPSTSSYRRRSHARRPSFYSGTRAGTAVELPPFVDLTRDARLPRGAAPPHPPATL